VLKARRARAALARLLAEPERGRIWVLERDEEICAVPLLAPDSARPII
jgi:hypothetical protein